MGLIYKSSETIEHEEKSLDEKLKWIRDALFKMCCVSDDMMNNNVTPNIFWGISVRIVHKEMHSMETM